MSNSTVSPATTDANASSELGPEDLTPDDPEALCQRIEAAERALADLERRVRTLLRELQLPEPPPRVWRVPRRSRRSAWIDWNPR